MFCMGVKHGRSHWGAGGGGRRLRVSVNRVLRRIFEAKKDEVTGDWGKLHNEELNFVYFSPNIIRVIKSIKMRWTGHVACIGG